MPLSEVKPYWTQATMPHFNTRTETVYTKRPLSFLKERNINNKLFSSLAAGLPEGAAIAGGFMVSVVQRDTKASDIDIFFTSEDAFKRTYELLKNPPQDPELWAWRGYTINPNDERSFESNTAAFRFVKFTHPSQPPIQLVKLIWYENYGHIIDSFDFTLTQIAATKNNIYFNPVTFLDLCRRQLFLHRMQFPTSSLHRLIKYTKKGYYTPKETLIAIAQQGANLIAQQGGEVVYQDAGASPGLTITAADEPWLPTNLDDSNFGGSSDVAQPIVVSPATLRAFTFTTSSDNWVQPESAPTDNGSGPSRSGSMY